MVMPQTFSEGTSGGAGAGYSWRTASTRETMPAPKGWCELSCRDVGAGQCSLAGLAKTLGAQTPEQIKEASRRIAQANRVPWSVEAINAWVISVGGRWAPRVPGTDPVPGSPTGGWALLSPTSVILLPCSARKTSPRRQRAGLSTAAKVGIGVAVVGALTAAGAAIARARAGEDA